MRSPTRGQTDGLSGADQSGEIGEQADARESSTAGTGRGRLPAVDAAQAIHAVRFALRVISGMVAEELTGEAHRVNQLLIASMPAVCWTGSIAPPRSLSRITEIWLASWRPFLPGELS